jgi:conjugal transfer pilus assembly protein TraB
MSVSDRWEGLPPGLRRALVLGGAAAALFGLATLLVSNPSDERGSGDERQRVVRNLLTDADPRAIGIEGLAERLRRLETQMGQVAAGLDKLGLAGDTKDPTRDALIEGLRQEHARQLAALRAEQEALRQAMAAAGGSPPTITPALPVSPSSPAPEPMPPRATKPLDALFEPPADGVRRAPDLGRMPPTGPDTARAGKPLEIRRIAADAPATEPDTTPDDAVLIPAGSLLRGVLLSGMDAPTGRAARRDPYPALARLSHEAILPNRFRADVRECFLVLAGYGDLGSERAYLRAETLACVREDGGAIEVPLDAYATGEDGKVGVRGRVVSKQGKVLAQAMMAAFVEGFSKLFATVPVTTVATSGGGTLPFQSVLSAQAVQGAAISGAGSALDRLAGYYLDLAEELFPVIEIDAGRSVEFVLNRGATLRLASHRGESGRGR